MGMARQPYIFKEKDTGTIILLGYEFNGIRKAGFCKFMKWYYQGFDLAQLLLQIDPLMTPHADTQLTRLISVDHEDLRVELFNQYTSEDNALIFDRIFYKVKGRIHVSHEYLIIPVTARNQGLARKVLKASLQQYLKMGVKMVHVLAGLSIGAYVWATHGYVAVNRSEMDNILRRAGTELLPHQYLAVKAVYDSYYSIHPKGVAFPIHQWADMEFMRVVLMNRESQWEGTLDLENEKQLRKFEKYVSK